MSRSEASKKADPNGVKPMDTGFAEKYTGDELQELHEDRDFDLNATKGKGKGFQGQCCHCGQYGHRVAECSREDADTMKEKGKSKEFGKWKNTEKARAVLHGSDSGPAAGVWAGHRSGRREN